MDQRNSRRLGWGTVLRSHEGFKRRVRVYEALRPLACRSCTRMMPAGDRFSRGRAGTTLCWLCQPFEMLDEES